MDEEARPLCVLGAFQPFGLTAERLQPTDIFSYFLFDPQLAQSASSSFQDDLSAHNYDEELFIHANCVVWSAGGQVRKRFTAPSAILQAVWCRFPLILEPVLCILYSESLATFTPAGEMTIIPLPHAVASLWPIPYGLVLQRGFAEKGLTCSTSSASKLPSLDCNILTQSNFPGSFAAVTHFSLQHPLEELQALQQEKDGMFCDLTNVHEQIIWSSSDVPFLASYHKGTLQHSIWRLKLAHSEGECRLNGLQMMQSHPVEVSNSIYLQCVWQDKGVHKIADQVFSATGDDSVPILCFLMTDSQVLFAFRLNTTEDHSWIGDKTWTIHAIAAAPVVATRPWSRQSCKQFDLLILSANGVLSLHRGKHQLCQLYFPWNAMNGINSSMPKESCSYNTDQIVTLRDPVQGRVNIVVSSGQVFRCAISRRPVSALALSCMMALDEGLQSPLKNHVVSSMWRHTYSWPRNPAAWEVGQGSSIDPEWASFANLLIKWCNGSSLLGACETTKTFSPWELLLSSNLHHTKKNTYIGLSSLPSKLGMDYRNETRVDQKEVENTDILTQILAILHAVYEDYKLDSLHWSDLRPLASLLGHMASWLGEWNYADHYARDFPNLYEVYQGLPPQTNWQALKVPFSVFGCLEEYMTHSKNNFSHELPSIYLSKNSLCVRFTRKVLALYEILAHKEAVAGVLPSGVNVSIADGSCETPEQRLVLAMVGENFSLADLDRLPVGVSLPLRHALNSCREALPSDWPRSAFFLVGREDLASMCSKKHIYPSATCMAAPYMLHLQPISSTACENSAYENASTETISSMDKAIDGMEHMFNGTVQLRFGRDLRLNEVRRLLCSSKPVAVRMANPPDVSDPDMVAQQQAHLWQLAQRTTSLAFGRGAFTLATMRTLLTEVLGIPELVLAGRLPSQHDAMVNLDSSNGNLSDLTSWPEYHNGVSAGLRLAPCQDKITRTWIVYNRPEEASFAHAGLLMSLGLQGHLRVLAATDVYRYLSQEHEATTVGILLGMAAAHRGTMEPAISKILYLHIPARHPPSFPELELPNLMQSAALMAVGLLYQGSAHRLTTEILLGEIGRKPGIDNVLEREGYALAAGLALGLVTLGKGKSAWGLADLSIEERLLHYMSGGTEPGEGQQLRPEGTSNHTFVSASRNLEDLYQNNGQVMEGSIVNLDVTAPGATLALGLMFLKTNCKEVAARLATPETHFALEYVRPDFILLRVVARNLVLWDSVQATEDWVQAQVPSIIKEFIVSLTKDKEGSDIRSAEVDMEALAQAHVNILAGACLSVGLRYAGTSSTEAQQLLYQYALYFLKEKRSASPVGGIVGPNGKCSYVDRGTLETCLNVAVLSLSVVMAGSGHLGTFRLLRYLRRRSDADGAINYGNHMAVNLALGFLFLGGGRATFATNNSAVAALLISLYPRFPTAPNDHRCHLQAFRHLYVLATETRCIETVDVDTGLPVYAPLEITLEESSSHAETNFYQVTPCLLPERSVLKRVRVCGPRYWPQDIKLNPCVSSWWGSNDISSPFGKGNLYVKRKVGARSYDDDPIGCRSLISRTLHKSLRDVNAAPECNSNSEVDEVVGTFSADPSLLSFAHTFCTKVGSQFEEFCLQALLECVSSDKSPLLQAYLSFYTLVEELVHDARRPVGTPSNSTCRSLPLSSLKIALAYSEAVRSKSLPLQGEPLLQRTFLEALAIQVEGALNPMSRESAEKGSMSSSKIPDLPMYLKNFQKGHPWTPHCNPSLLAYYLQWYNVPCPSLLCKAFEQLSSSSLWPLCSTNLEPSFSLPSLALLLPGTATKALVHISELLCS